MAEDLSKQIKELENKIFLLDLQDEEASSQEYFKLENELNALRKKKKSLEKEEKKITKRKKEEIKYEVFNDPNLNCNQWVIEIYKAGNVINGKFMEEFSVYTNLYYALNRLGEQHPCVHALLYCLNNNKHLFNFVLWRANFEKELGYKEHAYYDAINALFYYRLLEKTNRVKRNEKGTCCKVYIFHVDLRVEDLPKERFNSNDNNYMKIVKQQKG